MVATQCKTPPSSESSSSRDGPRACKQIRFTISFPLRANHALKSNLGIFKEQCLFPPKVEHLGFKQDGEDVSPSESSWTHGQQSLWIKTDSLDSVIQQGSELDPQSAEHRNETVYRFGALANKFLLSRVDIP